MNSDFIYNLERYISSVNITCETNLLHKNNEKELHNIILLISLSLSKAAYDLNVLEEKNKFVINSGDREQIRKLKFMLNFNIYSFCERLNLETKKMYAYQFIKEVYFDDISLSTKLYEIYVKYN